MIRSKPSRQDVKFGFCRTLGIAPIRVLQTAWQGHVFDLARAVGPALRARILHSREGGCRHLFEHLADNLHMFRL